MASKTSYKYTLKRAKFYLSPVIYINWHNASGIHLMCGEFFQI